jgi:hypothetical protein
VTPIGPSLVGIFAPQTFENDDANGAGGDMVVDKEILVGDMLLPLPHTSLPQRSSCLL